MGRKKEHGKQNSRKKGKRRRRRAKSKRLEDQTPSFERKGRHTIEVIYRELGRRESIRRRVQPKGKGNQRTSRTVTGSGV